jgi:hypothetical protein
MKTLSTFFAVGTVALTLSTPVLAGSVGIARSYASDQPDAQTIAKSGAGLGGFAARSARRQQGQSGLCAQELRDRSARATHEERAAGLAEPG